MDEATWFASTDPAAIIQRLYSQAEQVGECLLRTGYVRKDGYSLFSVGSRIDYAHRFAYELFASTIPEGLEVDHLCRNRRCVNPAHLELVTSVVNTLRGEGPTAQNARKTHCPKNHPFDTVNTYIDKRGHRYCRECERQKSRRNKARRRANGEKV